MFLGEIYVLENNYLTTNFTDGFIRLSQCSVSIEDNILIFNNSAAYKGAYIFDTKLTRPFCIEMEYIEISGLFTFGVGIVSDSYIGTGQPDIMIHYYGKVNNDYWGIMSLPHKRPATGDIFRWEILSDSHVKFYKNSELLIENSTLSNLLNNRFAIVGTDIPYKQSWKNIKIRYL